MKPTRYPKRIKLGITAAQAAKIKHVAAHRSDSEASVVRSAIDQMTGPVRIYGIDPARKAGKVRA